MFFSLEFPNKATKGKNKRDRKFNTIKQLTVLKRTLKQDLSSNFSNFLTVRHLRSSLLRLIEGNVCGFFSLKF